VGFLLDCVIRGIYGLLDLGRGGCDGFGAPDGTRLWNLLRSPGIPDQQRVAAIEAMVQERSAGEAAALLTEAGRGVPLDVLGYSLFP
jgi:hypothetical protein